MIISNIDKMASSNINQGITEQFVRQLIKKDPDVDVENPSVKLYCSEYRNNTCIPHSTNAKSYVFVNGKLFLKGYPYSIELSQNQLTELEFEKCRFYEAHEGTLLRVFNIDGKWYTSTNRRLDAFNSKWAAKTTTFGIHFAEAVQENIRSMNDDDIFEDDENETLNEKKISAKKYLSEIYEKSLDKSKKYMFLLAPCHEERIVCTTKKPTFFNIGVVDKDNNLSLDEEVILDGFVVPMPKEVVFKDLHHMGNDLENININDIQGYIAIQRNDEGLDDKHFKIMNDKYKYFFDLRGNTPSIRFRFIQLYLQDTFVHLTQGTNQQTSAQTRQKLEHFCQMYDFNPQPLLNYIWNTIVSDLFEKYRMRYMTKSENVNVTEKQDYILKEIHKHFCESIRMNQRRRTDKRRINDILVIQTPTILNQLIAEYEKQDRDAARDRKLID
jgi:hypothetical protein